MKKIFTIVSIIMLVAGTANAGVFMTARGNGAGKMGVEGSLGLVSTGGQSGTDLGAKFSYGFTNDIDGYGRLMIQSAGGASNTWFGGGAKGNFMKAGKDIPVDLAWVGDFSMFSMNMGGLSGSVMNLIGGVIVSKELDNSITPYGVVGLSFSSYPSFSINFGTGVVTQSTATSTGIALGGGASYAIAKNMNVKGELLMLNSQGNSGTNFGAAFEYII